MSSGGPTWRRHRAITAPAFTEKNNRLVWKETIEVTQSLLDSWVDADKTVSTLGSDTMRLSLEVIGRAGFGERMEWPKAAGVEAMTSDNLAYGHTMSFTAALQDLVKYIFWIIAVPRWLLRELNTFIPTSQDTD